MRDLFLKCLHLLFHLEQNYVFGVRAFVDTTMSMTLAPRHDQCGDADVVHVSMTACKRKSMFHENTFAIQLIECQSVSHEEREPPSSPNDRERMAEDRKIACNYLA